MGIGEYVFSRLASFPGGIGFYFKDLNTGEILEINGNRQFPAASVIKIPLCLKMAELLAEGKYKLTDKISIKENNRIGGTGVIQNLNKEYVPTIGELMTLALSVSDNIATNELVDLVGGLDAVTEYCRINDLPNTSMQRKMLDMEARKAGRENYISANDIGKLLERICNFSYDGTEEEKAIFFPVFKGMVMQQCRNKIPAKVPAIEFFALEEGKYLPPQGSVLVANKTGDLQYVQNDSSICVLPNGVKYILVICTDGFSATVEGIELVADLSKGVYSYMAEKYK